MTILHALVQEKEPGRPVSRKLKDAAQRLKGAFPLVRQKYRALEERIGAGANELAAREFKVKKIAEGNGSASDLETHRWGWGRARWNQDDNMG